MEHVSDSDNLRVEVVSALLDDASTFLEPEIANRRLNSLRNARTLSAQELALEVNKFGFRLKEDQVGGIILPSGDNMLDRRVLLEQTDSQIVEYHNSAHEGIHILGPDSWSRDDDIFGRRYVAKSLGPKWTILYLDGNGEINHSEPIREEEKLFWEAATDFVAFQKTREKFGSDKADQELVDHGVGFVQRYWIEYLINKHPNPDDFLKTIKQALYTGKEIDFLRTLGGHLDRPDIPFYRTLLLYMHEGEIAFNEKKWEDYDRALNKWMEAIDFHFKNGGAYSLDMTNF